MNLTPVLTWFLLLMLGWLSSLWSERKGYNKKYWILAPFGSICTCFLILPFLPDVAQISDEHRARTKRNGEITGLVLSLIYPALLVLALLTGNITALLGFGLGSGGKS
jgi:hypothetical protein